MSTMLNLPIDSFGSELAGIFPSYDAEASESSPRSPREPLHPLKTLVAAAAAEREAAELSRIARAEDAWRRQVAIDLVDEASMESFPCSDPPGYYTAHV